MIQLTDHGVFLVDGEVRDSASVSAQEARQQTMAWNILQAHNTSGDPEHLKVRFDAMCSVKHRPFMPRPLAAQQFSRRVDQACPDRIVWVWVSTSRVISLNCIKFNAPFC